MNINLKIATHLTLEQGLSRSSAVSEWMRFFELRDSYVKPTHTGEWAQLIGRNNSLRMLRKVLR